jgi:putative addiction module component (TIGR02574 family)
MLAEDIEQKALKLSAVKRIRLVEVLLDSLDKTDSEIEKIWVQESEQRYQAYKDGQIEGVSFEQVRNSIES